MKRGATASILRFARLQPGGVISWGEAAARYRMATGIPRSDHHYHMNLGHIFRRHFERVEGARGLYVLREAITGRRMDGVWVSRSKERVAHRYYCDDVYRESRDYVMFVYCREDGTEFIDQKRRRAVTRIDGKPTIEMYSYTVGWNVAKIVP